MNLDLVFKIAAAGIIVAILNQVLVRAGREEQATMVTLSGLITVLLIMIRESRNFDCYLGYLKSCKKIFAGIFYCFNHDICFDIFNNFSFLFTKYFS